MNTQVFDREKLLKLAAWAQFGPKHAFVDPAAAGGMPPSGPPPMDPAMMAGMPPMDPAAMGGMPPMGGMPAGDPMMAAPPEAALPPPDPSAQAMGDQEMMRNIIREEIRSALCGGGEGGVAAGGKKSGNKFEDALRVLEEKMKEQSKIFVAALRNAGIEIPLADLYGIDKADGSGAPAVAPTAAQGGGISETLQTGLGGDATTSQPGKIGAVDPGEDQIAQLMKLAETKDHLQRSTITSRRTVFDPQAEDLSYLAGLFR